MITYAAANRTPRRIRRAIVPAVLGALVLAGCGSSSSGGSSSSTATQQATTTAATTGTTSTTAASSGAAAGGALALSANPGGQLEYNTKSLSAKAGKVTIDFTNQSPVGHNVTLENSAGATVGATPTFQGGSKSLSLNLKPGTYKFFCSVPGHRMAGMEGTLVVK